MTMMMWCVEVTSPRERKRCAVATYAVMAESADAAKVKTIAEYKPDDGATISVSPWGGDVIHFRSRIDRVA